MNYLFHRRFLSYLYWTMFFKISFYKTFFVSVSLTQSIYYQYYISVNSIILESLLIGFGQNSQVFLFALRSSSFINNLNYNAY